MGFTQQRSTSAAVAFDSAHLRAIRRRTAWQRRLPRCRRAVAIALTCSTLLLETPWPLALGAWTWCFAEFLRVLLPNSTRTFSAMCAFGYASVVVADLEGYLLHQRHRSLIVSTRLADDDVPWLLQSDDGVFYVGHGAVVWRHQTPDLGSTSAFFVGGRSWPTGQTSTSANRVLLGVDDDVPIVVPGICLVAHGRGFIPLAMLDSDGQVTRAGHPMAPFQRDLAQHRWVDATGAELNPVPLVRGHSTGVEDAWWCPTTTIPQAPSSEPTLNIDADLNDEGGIEALPFECPR